MLSEGNPIHIVSQGLKQGDLLMLSHFCAYPCIPFAKPLEVTFDHPGVRLLPSVSWRASATAFYCFQADIWGSRKKRLGPW